MPASKAQQKAVNKYMSANYDRINLLIPKGRKETIETRAKENGESVNGYLNRLIQTDLGLPAEEWKAAKKEKEAPAD